MGNIEIRKVNRRHAQRLLAQRPHLVQTSPFWLDFLKDFCGEIDRSVILYLDGNPVAYVPALQYKKSIQSLPYPASYAGPVFDESISDFMVEELLEKLCDYYRGFADVFTICTPPFGSTSSRWHDSFEFTYENPVQYIDLSQDPLSLTTSKFRNNLKRNLRKAAQARLRVSTEVDEYILSLWYGCYRKRMESLGSSCLPADFFLKMWEHLRAERAFRLFSVWLDEWYVGGIVAVYNRFCADYYLAMFDRDYDHLQPGTFAFHEMLCWARAEGIRYLNLQSSPNSAEDLHRFKKAWGAQEGKHCYFSVILKNRDKLLKSTAEEAAHDYPFHFLLPFSALRNQTAGRGICKNDGKGVGQRSDRYC